jgi:hypothetical protein
MATDARDYEMSEAEYANDWDRCDAIRKKREVVQNPVWRSKDGRVLTVDQMGIGHIINSMWLLKRKGFNNRDLRIILYDPNFVSDTVDMQFSAHNAAAIENKYSPWFEIFFNELKNRGFTQDQIDSWFLDVHDESKMDGVPRDEPIIVWKEDKYVTDPVGCC